MIIVKVPGINGLGRTKGTRNAGVKILEDFGSQYKYEEIHVDNFNLEEQESLIRKNAVKLFEEEDKVIFIGGDHSISYPLVDSFRKVHGNDFRLVVFDAHADCMPAMREPTHEEWLRALIENGWKGSDVLIIGLRKVEREEKEFLDIYGVKRISVEEIRYDSLKSIKWLRNFISRGKIYASFDVDVFDPSIVKATGFLEEDGLREEEVMRLIDVIKEGSVVGFDLVEIDLNKGVKDVEETVRLARKVLEKFIGNSHNNL